MHELKRLLVSHSPDVVAITGTKLNKTNCNSCVIKDVFEDYTLFHSCNAPVDPLRGRQPLDRWIAMALEVSL